MVARQSPQTHRLIRCQYLNAFNFHTKSGSCSPSTFIVSYSTMTSNLGVLSVKIDTSHSANTIFLKACNRVIGDPQILIPIEKWCARTILAWNGCKASYQCLRFFPHRQIHKDHLHHLPSTCRLHTDILSSLPE